MPVCATFAFDDVRAAHALMDAGDQIGKVVLTLSRAARGATPDGIRPAMHPRWLRCSFFKYGPDILSRRALPSWRLAGLGARRACHHGLLDSMAAR